jgi:hypothetical protein
VIRDGVRVISKASCPVMRGESSEIEPARRLCERAEFYCAGVLVDHDRRGGFGATRRHRGGRAGQRGRRGAIGVALSGLIAVWSRRLR